MEKIFNFEDRLVRFAGECIFFTRQFERLFENEYYKNQLIRSSGSASLNFGEAQGTVKNDNKQKIIFNTNDNGNYNNNFQN
ncbi:hypothetical protein PQ462_08670 [Flavobacterium sp. KACC 22758]|uniref:hypothetical protein n=1 Tax=Flavobacterium sp. KACC 22758 TaxID=3025667 RepID=UPI0023671FAF|nr:hypothetical protein [Flavobacterium sp. KACC 22758]WDF61439.1 hypothetical protein PQ462_08670 [Flavobacterium sp. KACC 22758]